MADESSVAAGKRFSRDMRLIREDREVSIDSIHKETRISRSLIESFEQGGLYDHPTFNEVYLRSFVRAYAGAVEISQEAVLDGLEAALEGAYESALADRYLKSTPTEDDDSSTAELGPEASESSIDEGSSDSGMESNDPQSVTPSAGGPEGRGGIVGPPRALDDEDSGSEEEEARPSSVEGASEGPETSSSAPPPESDDPPQSSSPVSAPKAESDSDAEDEEIQVEDEEEEDEAATDEPDPTPDLTGEGPTWMDEGSEADADPSPSLESEDASPEPIGAGQRGEPPEEGIGETGIVGEPTAVGSEEGPAEVARPKTSPPSSRSSQRRSGWLQFLKGEKREMVWAGMGIVIILLVLVGLGIAYTFSDKPSDKAATQEDRQTVAAPDTSNSSPSASSEDTTATSAQPPPADIALGDTLYLTVRATEPVSNIRIQRDADLRRPYWIEDGEARVFPFQRRVTLENELADFELFLAGYPYPVGRLDTTEQIAITRAEAEAFVDTLRGSPAALNVPIDTIPKGLLEQ